ncbi:hypothetical protein RJ640_016836 [Escallonia rubra]|uniref:Peptidase A1 domain-containing protein n=1 Tax=Escallonia rubra TaxID=112253 RepID=A0AA88S4F9_9ASTE|nr:hypothetical protein RJ640_016836 [Escallonia rubra]
MELVASASIYCKILLLSFMILASTYINAAATAATFAKPRRIVTKLIHRDSVHSPFYVANVTVSDHAQEAIENSEARIASIHERIRNYGSMDDLGAKVIAVDKGNIFFVNLYIGELAVSQFVIMDTASSLLWVHCLPYKGCEDKVNPIYNHVKSYMYANLSCDSAYCVPSIRGTCGPNRTCIYSLGYRDNASST